MAEDDKIKYSDLIQPDDSIEKLIKQLGELNQSYETMVVAIRAGADRIVHALKSASSATDEGRKSIDEATAASSRLKRAQKELEFALSDTGKKVAWLKSQTSEANRITVEQQRYIKQAVSSYDRLKSELKQSVTLYKSLTEAEREDSQMGQQLLQDILNLKNQIAALDAQMKPHIQTLNQVQKAEQKLAFLQSEEGKKLLELKAKISEITNARRQHKTTIDSSLAMQQKLAFAQSEENEQLKLYSTLIQEANRVAKLRAQISSSAEGSYNRLSAQYALNKIKLNQMSAAEREAADTGKKLETETNAIYQQMIKLQEATGNYRLSVGHYQKAWDGLGFSVTQVVRELPAAVVSLNTFFLGISNNMPLVIDEINRLKVQNQQLQAQGKPTINITKQIISSLLSWNTALVVVLTALSMYGGAIAEWIVNIFKGKDAVMSMSEALDNVADELEKTNGSYGSNIVSLKKLQQEWKGLKTTAEKKQWITDNKTEFDRLGIAINGVTDAENVFINNTDAVIEALKLRAKAAAAEKLATEQYEKALVSRNKAETKSSKGPTTGDKVKNWFAQISLRTLGQSAASWQLAENLSAETFRRQEIKDLMDEANAAEKAGDAYFKLAASYEKSAQAQLSAAGIDEPHKKTKVKKGRRERQPVDLTNTINRNDIKIQKQYEESVTKLQRDEYAKRRKEAADQVANANRQLEELYRKNEEYVNNTKGKYKQLTEDQKKMIAQQQQWINLTISNNLKQLGYQIEQIQKEQQVNSVKIMRESVKGINSIQQPTSEEDKYNITSRIGISYDENEREKSLVKERQLMSQYLDIEYKMVSDANKKLLEENDKNARSEEEITAEYQKKFLQLWADYDKLILSMRSKNIETQLELVQHGSEEELKLLLEQNEIARKMALAENAARPAAEQLNTDDINALYDRYSKQIRGSFEITSLEETQKAEEAKFNIIERSSIEIEKLQLEQEKDMWNKKIQLARSGALNWSKPQIEAAENAVKEIENKLSKLDSFTNLVGEKGVTGALLTKLGFDDDQISALENAGNIIINQLQEIAQAEVDAAQAAVDAAKERVDAAQSAYEDEIEARNNGYANNVATAKKELQQEKKNQLEKQKLLAQAQRRQEAINTIVQASSLVTASANLWSAFSSIPVVGPALAIAAIATMWTSFAAAKIKASQVTASEEYGEGGIEFLEGGSHASGNDIDLHQKNSKGKNMRAEGGEAMAIINKRNTRKYHKVLPDIVKSLNKGNFEEKYLNAFQQGDVLQASINENSTHIDLAKLEKDVESIKKQNEVKYYSLSNGSTLMVYKNVKRIIK